MTLDTVRDEMLERPLPNSPEIERVILGSILIDNTVIYKVLNILTTEDFYVPSHRYIYSAMRWLIQQGQVINQVTIYEVLRQQGHDESVGSISYISGLLIGMPHIIDIEQLCETVKGKSLLRQFAKKCQLGYSNALEEEDLPEVIIQTHAAEIFQLQQHNTEQTFHTVGELSVAAIEHAQVVAQSGSTLTGISTGFTDLDTLTLGLQPSDLIIVAGRPSMGKSAYAFALAQHAAIREGLTVAIFSLEMSKEQVIARILCSEAQVDGYRFRKGYLSHEEWDKLNVANQQLAQARLFINDKPAVTTEFVQWQSKQLVQEQGSLHMIVVDYLQLMSGAARRNENRQQEVSQISYDLKALAKELNVPLIALSQLNRAPEGRSSKKPILSDLRESGAIEQTADVVEFVYREDAYHPDAPIAEHSNLAEIIIAKQRNGPTGVASLRFDGPTTKFSNLYQE